MITEEYRSGDVLGGCLYPTCVKVKRSSSFMQTHGTMLGSSVCEEAEVLIHALYKEGLRLRTMPSSFKSETLRFKRL